jgi:hypothetical protein
MWVAAHKGVCLFAAVSLSSNVNEHMPFLFLGKREEQHRKTVKLKA